ncbi:MAG: carbonic anhydrase [Armatimonadetes bacterium]|nr:carbonic anhydrase [Armatimonadota bacterium]
MSALLPVRRPDDILPDYRDTPVADLLAYHNLGAPHRAHHRAELLIGACMDNRVLLRVPEKFAFILRAGGANFRRIEFKVSFAVAVGGIRTICLVAHSQCGMVGLRARRDVFVDGLVSNGGWDRADAEQHFDQFAPVFEIPDAAAFVVSEARRLRERYPRVTVAPLFYQVEDGLLYHIAETD